jgi:predicted peptidase
MKKLLMAFLALLATSIAPVPPAAAASINEFLNFSLPNPAGPTPLLPGRLYVPPEAAGGPRPFILFLHGAGESGSNNSLQVNINIDNLLAEAKRRGAYLYAPQTNNGWANAATNARVMSMVDRAIMEQSVDPRRLYVTGLSMGGGGTWNFLNAYGDRFAAGVPICPIAPAPGIVYANLLDEPIWDFHARNDSTVAVRTSRNVIDFILAAAGESPPTYLASGVPIDMQFQSTTLDLRYTEYYTGGHGIWTRAYNGATNAAMYDWLFAHASVPEPTALIVAAVAAPAALTFRRRHGRRPWRR